jgi:hypothetical protein
MYVNRTSQERVIRTEGAFSVTEATRRGAYDVYPVYLTADLEALAAHPMFWEDPTIDYATRTVAAIYVRSYEPGVQCMSIETLDWSADGDSLGEVLDQLAAHLAGK